MKDLAVLFSQPPVMPESTRTRPRATPTHQVEWMPHAIPMRVGDVECIRALWPMVKYSRLTLALT